MMIPWTFVYIYVPPVSHLEWHTLAAAYQEWEWDGSTHHSSLCLLLHISPHTRYGKVAAKNIKVFWGKGGTSISLPTNFFSAFFSRFRSQIRISCRAENMEELFYSGPELYKGTTICKRVRTALFDEVKVSSFSAATWRGHFCVSTCVLWPQEGEKRVTKGG